MPPGPFLTIQHGKLARLVEYVWAGGESAASFRMMHMQSQRSKLSSRSWQLVKETDAILLSIRSPEGTGRKARGTPAPSPASASESSSSDEDWAAPPVALEDVDVGLQDMLTRRHMQLQKVKFEAKRIRVSSRRAASDDERPSSDSSEASSSAVATSSSAALTSTSLQSSFGHAHSTCEWQAPPPSARAPPEGQSRRRGGA